MPGIPRLHQLDSTIAFMQDPYRFISSHARALKSDVFETRLLLEKTICMTGREAAKIFTDEELFIRNGAAPEPIKATLFGKGGVQGLDGEAHRHRKSLFMSFVTQDNVSELCGLVNSWLDVYSKKWIIQSGVVLYEEFQEILTRAVCEWAGIHLVDEEVKLRKNQLTALFDSAGSPLKHFSSRASRKSAERWIKTIVEEIRNGKSSINEGSPAAIISQFRDINGKLLSSDIAAVEILNLLRPMVAVSVYLVFSIHALHLHRESKQRLKSQEPGYLDHFVNEVRRYYPFFPALAARVNQDFMWGRMKFTKGTRVMLDIFGTNHDERIWVKPFEFFPDRFKDHWSGPFDFIPQGAGDHNINHRCPGELFTIELMRTVIDFFTMNIYYTIPAQELRVEMNRLPALPKSRMVITDVIQQFPFVKEQLTTGVMRDDSR